jgi:hypothetical protein
VRNAYPDEEFPKKAARIWARTYERLRKEAEEAEANSDGKRLACVGSAASRGGATTRSSVAGTSETQRRSTAYSATTSALKRCTIVEAVPHENSMPSGSSDAAGQP